MNSGQPAILRRVLASFATAATLVTAVTACSGSSLDNPSKQPAGNLKVGLMWPMSGPYKAIGDDLSKGFQLYLDNHGNKLGGHPIESIYADEAEGKQSAINAAKKLIEKDGVTVLAGTGTAESVESIKALVTERKIPLVGTGGRPSTLDDVTHIWHTSWLSRDAGQGVAAHIRKAVDGPVYAIGPDYVGGHDQIGGFVDSFTKEGGKLANEGGKPAWTPWPATTNFLPYLNQVKGSGAKAVYAFYAGTAAVEFVKQYEQAGLKGQIPLYGPGFLTEGAVLGAEGAAADGVRTVMNYAASIKNPTNEAFTAAYKKKHNATPNIYNVTGYDAALVLDRAIAAAGPNPTSASINDALAKLGDIDSPRGHWRFGTSHTPVQPWYLREVKTEGTTRANVVIENLPTIGS